MVSVCGEGIRKVYESVNLSSSLNTYKGVLKFNIGEKRCDVGKLNKVSLRFSVKTES